MIPKYRSNPRCSGQLCFFPLFGVTCHFPVIIV
jgi:hypothetical protein